MFYIRIIVIEDLTFAKHLYKIVFCLSAVYTLTKLLYNLTGHKNITS